MSFAKRMPDENDAPETRLLKLLPAEPTAVFIGLIGLFRYDPDLSISALVTFYVFAVATTMLTPFFLAGGIPHLNPSIKWRDVFSVKTTFVTFSFVVWALNIDLNRTEMVGEILGNYWEPIRFVVDGNVIRGLLLIWAGGLVPLAMQNK